MYKVSSTSKQYSQRFQEIFSLSKQFSNSQNFSLDEVFDEAVKFQDPQCSQSEIWQELVRQDFKKASRISTNPANHDYDVWLAFGETGQGKSAFVNAICGPHVAVEGKGIRSKTENINLHVSKKHKIIMIDTPGLFATQKMKNEEISYQIIGTVQNQLKQNAHIKAIFFIWSPTSSMRLRLDEILTVLRKALGKQAIESVIFLVNQVSHSWNEDHEDMKEEFFEELEAEQITNPVFVCDIKEMTSKDIEELKGLTQEVNPFREEDFEAHRERIYEKKFFEAQRNYEEKKKEREKIQKELSLQYEQKNKEMELKIAQIQKEAAEEKAKQNAQYQALQNSYTNTASDYYSFHPVSYQVYDYYSEPTVKPSEPKVKVSEPSTEGKKFYKGGQFIPGGGHAPKGGCYAQPTPTQSHVSQSSTCSHGQGTFYKGGQFIPGGGHAPKGGVWIK